MSEAAPKDATPVSETKCKQCGRVIRSPIPFCADHAHLGERHYIRARPNIRGLYEERRNGFIPDLLNRL